MHLMKLPAVALAGTFVLSASLTSSVRADDSQLSGRATVYENLHEDSLESVTDRSTIIGVTRSNVAASEVWRALEHGEKTECLDCIPYVARLIYDSHGDKREIAAWWLRRRIFGVFGPGQVYSQVVATLQTDADEMRRAYAAEALGEFLVRAGIKHVAQALVSDPSPRVRLSAALALRRLNSQGPTGELGLALGDVDARVRLAALKAAVQINSFSRVDAVLERISDENPEVRRLAAEALGQMRVIDAVVGLVALTSPDTEPDARVRVAAVAALGEIGDPVGKDAVEAAQGDPDFLVRSIAEIALRRL